MKSCPACRRNFDDDTLLYCTEDGTPLIVPSRSADPTLRISSARDTDPPATEILPHGFRLPTGAPSASEPTQVPPTQYAGNIPPTQVGGHVSPPVNYAPVNPSYQTTATPPAPSRGPWIIVAAVFGVVALGAIAGVAYLLLRPADSPNKNAAAQTASTPAPNNNGSSNSNSGGGTSSNTNTGGDVSGTPDDWLYGEWEGGGTQADGLTWSAQLARDEDGTAIAYPTLSCGGVWEEISIEADTANFREKIRYGNCDDGALIKVTRLTDNQISVSWIFENTDIPVASATLNRTQAPQGK